MKDPLPAPRRVLVGHDFSPCADVAARAAVRDLLCTREGGTVVLAHIFELIPLPESAIEGGDATEMISFERTVAYEVTMRLERAAEELRRAIVGMRRDQEDAPVVEVEVVARQDSPVEGLLAVAREQETTRIVVGSHGRRGLAHFFLGSVAERVARTAKVPVLVVKEEEASP